MENLEYIVKKTDKWKRQNNRSHVLTIEYQEVLQTILQQFHTILWFDIEFKKAYIYSTHKLCITSLHDFIF